MKLCLVAPIPPFRGGIAKYCYSLALELEQRHDLLLLSYSRQYPTVLYGRQSQIDPDCRKQDILCQFSRLSYDLDSVNPFSWQRAVQAITAFGPEAVIIPWWVAYWTPLYLYLLAALKRRGIRTVFLCINVFEHENNPLKKLLTVSVLSRVNAIIVHSGQEQTTLRSFNTSAAIINHPLPLFRYTPPPAAERDDDRLHLLFFGFVRPYKGLDTLLRALALIRNHPVSLRVAGEFWQGKTEYLRLAEELGLSGMVELIDGYVSENDMGRHFAWADLLVLPYRNSVTSGVIATAYGFGKPVLATNVGGFCNVVKEGVTGKLVTPDDPQALAEGILWFVHHRGMDFANNIATFTAEQMSWRSLVDRIEEMIRTP